MSSDQSPDRNNQKPGPQDDNSPEETSKPRDLSEAFALERLSTDQITDDTYAMSPLNMDPGVGLIDPFELIDQDTSNNWRSPNRGIPYRDERRRKAAQRSLLNMPSPRVIGLLGLVLIAIIILMVLVVTSPTTEDVTQPTAAVPQATSTARTSRDMTLEIDIGAHVEVDTAANQQLTVRSDAGLSSPAAFEASANEAFVVVDGPRQVDGFIWWKIDDALEEGREGWAVATYLRVASAQDS